MTAQDTIAAIASASGRAGVGVIRISGKKVSEVATALLGNVPKPRQAHYAEFKAADGEVIDLGIALFFPGPNSFTGEDVLELQGHGGAVVLDRLLRAVLQHDVRMARAGEFSERAFLNDKIDLTQAEAIADLIDSGSEQAARCAIRNLQGQFSQRIHQLVEALVHLRMYVEAAIDFPEEEIDFLSDGKVQRDLTEIIEQLNAIISTAEQGVRLRDGMTIVIAGKPNAGKSTLLNQLSGRDSAIVTPLPGTTRDVMREHIIMDGLPLHIVDTAGLRDSEDVIEQEGIRRAWQEIEIADHVLLLVDSTKQTEHEQLLTEFKQKFPSPCPHTVIHNKIDKQNQAPQQHTQGEITHIALSAKTGAGIDLLKQHLKASIGMQNPNETQFIARRRHLVAMEEAKRALLRGQTQLQHHKAGELLAEECRQAQNALGQITGDFTTDDLLGRIFSSFCIGK